VVLKSNGSVFCWSIIDGNTNTDAFGVSLVPPASATNVIAIAAGTRHHMALRADSTVVTWGGVANGSVEPPPGVTNVIQISAGVSHCLALKSDGTVVAWGASTAVGILVVTWANGLSTVPSDATNMAAVAAGGLSFIGTSLNVNLRSNHTVYVRGSSGLNNLTPDGNPNQHVLQDYPDVSAIDACGDNVVALTTGGDVRAWSFQSLLTPPTNLTGIVAVVVGTTSVLGLKNDGTVIAWGVSPGFDGLAIPADGTNIVKTAAKSVFLRRVPKRG